MESTDFESTLNTPLLENSPSSRRRRSFIFLLQWILYILMWVSFVLWIGFIVLMPSHLVSQLLEKANSTALGITGTLQFQAIMSHDVSWVKILIFPFSKFSALWPVLVNSGVLYEGFYLYQQFCRSSTDVSSCLFCFFPFNSFFMYVNRLQWGKTRTSRNNCIWITIGDGENKLQLYFYALTLHISLVYNTVFFFYNCILT